MYQIIEIVLWWLVLFVVGGAAHWSLAEPHHWRNGGRPWGRISTARRVSHWCRNRVGASSSSSTARVNWRSLVNNVSGLNYATTTSVEPMIASVYNWLSTTYLESGLNHATTTIVASKLASVHNWLSRRIWLWELKFESRI